MTGVKQTLLHGWGQGRSATAHIKSVRALLKEIGCCKSGSDLLP